MESDFIILNTKKLEIMASTLTDAQLGKVVRGIWKYEETGKIHEFEDDLVDLAILFNVDL